MSYNGTNKYNRTLPANLNFIISTFHTLLLFNLFLDYLIFFTGRMKRQTYEMITARKYGTHHINPNECAVIMVFYS